MDSGVEKPAPAPAVTRPAGLPDRLPARRLRHREESAAWPLRRSLAVLGAVAILVARS